MKALANIVGIFLGIGFLMVLNEGLQQTREITAISVLLEKNKNLIANKILHLKEEDFTCDICQTSMLIKTEKIDIYVLKSTWEHIQNGGDFNLNIRNVPEFEVVKRA